MLSAINAGERLLVQLGSNDVSDVSESLMEASSPICAAIRLNTGHKAGTDLDQDGRRCSNGSLDFLSCPVNGHSACNEQIFGQNGKISIVVEEGKILVSKLSSESNMDLSDSLSFSASAISSAVRHQIYVTCSHVNINSSELMASNMRKVAREGERLVRYLPSHNVDSLSMSIRQGPSPLSSATRLQLLETSKELEEYIQHASRQSSVRLMPIIHEENSEYSTSETSCDDQNLVCPIGDPGDEDTTHFEHAEVAAETEAKDMISVSTVLNTQFQAVQDAPLLAKNSESMSPDLKDMCCKIQKELSDLNFILNMEIEASHRRQSSNFLDVGSIERVDSPGISSDNVCTKDFEKDSCLKAENYTCELVEYPSVQPSDANLSTPVPTEVESNLEADQCRVEVVADVFRIDENDAGRTHCDDLGHNLGLSDVCNVPADRDEVQDQSKRMELCFVSNSCLIDEGISTMLALGLRLAKIFPAECERLLETVLSARQSPIITVVRRALACDPEIRKVTISQVVTSGMLLLQKVSIMDAEVVLECLKSSEGLLASGVRELMLVTSDNKTELESFMLSLVNDGQVLVTELPDVEAAALVAEICVCNSLLAEYTRTKLRKMWNQNHELQENQSVEKEVCSDTEPNNVRGSARELNYDLKMMSDPQSDDICFPKDNCIPQAEQGLDQTNVLTSALNSIWESDNNLIANEDAAEDNSDVQETFDKDIWDELQVKSYKSESEIPTVYKAGDCVITEWNQDALINSSLENKACKDLTQNLLKVDSDPTSEGPKPVCTKQIRTQLAEEESVMNPKSNVMTDNYELSRLLCSVIPPRAVRKRVAFQDPFQQGDAGVSKSLNEESTISEESPEDVKNAGDKQVVHQIYSKGDVPQESLESMRYLDRFVPATVRRSGSFDSQTIAVTNNEDNKQWWTRTPSDPTVVLRPSLTQEQIQKIAGCYKRPGRNSNIKEYYFGHEEKIQDVKEPVKRHETFFTKLYEILMSDAHTNCVEWGCNGKSILFSDPLTFQNKVIPIHYPGTWRSECGALLGKACDFCEVVRILRSHGFKKIDPNDPDTQEYQHALFLKGFKDEVYKIRKGRTKVWQFPSPSRDIIDLRDLSSEVSTPHKAMSQQGSVYRPTAQTSIKDEKIRSCMHQLSANLNRSSKLSVSDIVLQLQRRKMEQNHARLSKIPTQPLAKVSSRVSSIVTKPSVLKNSRDQGQFSGKLVGIGYVTPEKGMRVKLSFTGLEHKIAIGQQTRNTLILLRGTIEDMEADCGMCKVRWQTGEEEFCCSGFCGKYYLEACIPDKLATDANWWRQQALLAPTWSATSDNSIWRMRRVSVGSQKGSKGRRAFSNLKDLQGKNVLEGVREEVTQYFNRLRAEEAKIEEEQRAASRRRRGTDTPPTQPIAATQIALGATTGSAAEDVGTFFRARGTLSEVVARGEMATLERLLRRAYDSMDPQPSGHVSVREILFSINRMKVGATKAAMKEVVSAHDEGEEELSYGGFLDLMYDLLSRCKVVPASTARRRSIVPPW